MEQLKSCEECNHAIRSVFDSYHPSGTRSKRIQYSCPLAHNADVTRRYSNCKDWERKER
jgi:hypothetical protein